MYFKERDVDQRFYNNSRVSSAISEDAPSYSYTGATYSPPVKVYGNRKGKWTTEEENYTNKVIWCFNAGTLPIAPDEMHVTLRSYLAEKLDCDPMRITKKYTGASCLGKKVYRIARSDDVSPEQLYQDQMELQMLEKAFLTKLDQMRSKKMLQGMSSEARRSAQSQAKDSSSSAFSPSGMDMDSLLRQSILDSYSSSSSYAGNGLGGAGGGGRNTTPAKTSLPSPTNYHYSLPPSLLQVTNDHYLEELKNDAAAAAEATAAVALNNTDELIRIPSLNSDLLFDTFGGPGSAFSSMGNLSVFGSFLVPTTPKDSIGAEVQKQLQQLQQSPSQQSGQGSGTPYKHKQSWIQRSSTAAAAGNPNNSGPADKTDGSDQSDSPSRATHSLSPGAVINDEGHLPPSLLDHKQQHVGLPEVYKSVMGGAVMVGSPATSYDDSTVGSSEGGKRKAGLGISSNCSSTSSSDSTLVGGEGGVEGRTGFNSVHGGDVSVTTGSQDSQPLSQNGSGGSGATAAPTGFKKRKMSEDMTAAASSLLGFFSQFHQNGVRESTISEKE